MSTSTQERIGGRAKTSVAVAILIDRLETDLAHQELYSLDTTRCRHLLYPIWEIANPTEQALIMSLLDTCRDRRRMDLTAEGFIIDLAGLKYQLEVGEAAAYRARTERIYGTPALADAS